MSLTWGYQAGPSAGIRLVACATDPINGVTCFTSVPGAGLWRTTDGCVTVAQPTTPPSGISFYGPPAFGGGKFLVSTDLGFYASTDDGQTWSAVAGTPSGFVTNGSHTTKLVFSPTLGTGSGMWMAVVGTTFSTSVDGGATWSAGAGISGIQGISRPPMIWDGTNFIFESRDSGNSNALLVYSADGSTWSTVNLGSIFGDNEPDFISYAGGQYIAAMLSGTAIRISPTLAGMASASNTVLTTSLPGCFYIPAAFTPDGQLFIATGANNTAGANAGLTELDSPSGSWAASISPLPANNYVLFFDYDPVHQVLIGLTNSTATNTLITAGYVPPNPVPNVLGDTQVAATAAITGAGFVLGTVTNLPSLTVLPGLVSAQNPAGGSFAAPGSAVNITIAQPAIAIAPTTANVQVNGGTQTFTPTAPAGSAFLWYVNGVQGGSAATGFVDGSGHYTAPVGVSSVPPPMTVTVALFEYPSTSASAAVTLTAPGTVTVYGKCAFSGQTADGHVSTHFQGVFPPVVLPKPATINPKIIAPVINTTVKA